MLQLNTRTLNLLAKIKEKLKGAVPLSPAEMSLRVILRRLQHRWSRLDRYRRRMAAYPYQGRRQIARNLRKMQKADERGLDYFGRVVDADLRYPWRRVQA